MKHFAFLKKVCHQYLICALSNFFVFFLRAADCPATNLMECIVISCNLISQLCLSGPRYNSCTVVCQCSGVT